MAFLEYLNNEIPWSAVDIYKLVTYCGKNIFMEARSGQNDLFPLLIFYLF